jgi:exopolysaccharide biosynthesis protein
VQVEIDALARLLLAIGVAWQPVRPGVWQTEIPLASQGPLSFVQAVVIRLDPAQFEFHLETATRDQGLRGAWTIDSLPPSGVVAFNAGQFTGGFPWGWLVRDGMETQPPRSGSLAMSFVVDRAGTVSLVTPKELPTIRSGARVAFQSYPALLVDAEEPWELRAPGRGVDLEHRDSRLALGILKDGTIVVALTRIAALGHAGGTLPWGPTVREIAEFMRSLGCQRAMLLDGGISSQLAVRGSDGTVSRWRNWRQVPLGLVVTPRRHDGPRNMDRSSALRRDVAASRRPGARSEKRDVP